MLDTASTTDGNPTIEAHRFDKAMHLVHALEETRTQPGFEITNRVIRDHAECLAASGEISNSVPSDRTCEVVRAAIFARGELRHAILKLGRPVPRSATPPSWPMNCEQQPLF